MSHVTSNKSRWQNIAKLAEQKAAKMSDIDNVYIRTNNNDVYMDFYTHTKSSMGHEAQINAEGSAAKYLLKQSDKYIADKIIKFIKLNRKEDLFTIELSNYLSKIKNKDTDFAQKLTDIVVDKAMDDAEKIVKADPFFKRAETLV